jgi:hypothetical protein
MSGATPSPLDAARQYIEAGFLPVPVPYKAKNPAFDGWPTLRLTADDAPKYFNGHPQNIGLIVGDDYGTTDIDLDCGEAVRAASFFLPETAMIFGRNSKPRSHWFYRLDPPLPTRTFKDVKKTGNADDADANEKKTMILELRCQKSDGAVGFQSIVPPSTHQDTGEVIRFEPGCGLRPANVDAPILMAAVERTAAAALLARHWPARGQGRHDAMLSLAGLLARASWNEADTKLFCRALYHALSDPDRNAMNRSDGEVESSFKRKAEGGTFTGWPSLAKSVGEDVLKLACRWLGAEQPRVNGPTQAGLPDALYARLIKGAKGKSPLGNIANVGLVLREHPDWQGRLRFDELRMRVTATNPTPIGNVKDGVWLDQHDLLLAEWMQWHEVLTYRATAGEAVFMVASENGFHPVREYLRSTPWDGTPRLDGLLSNYCGARGPDAQPADVLVPVGRKWMIQAVARAMKAGSKADYILVLEGLQGLLKSTVFAVLGGEFYSDDLASFATKDASQGVAGCWIIELPELVRLRGANVNMIKSFLSRSIDRFRPPYGKHTIEVPRSNVFCGTTNDDQYLLDVTGNRRFWPISVFEPADVDALRRDRDQLWAEALHLYQQHESHWVEPGCELEHLLSGEQEIRVAEDELEGPVISWVSTQVANEFARKRTAQSVGAPTDNIRPYVTMFEIYRFGLGLDATGAGGLSRVRDLGPRIGRILRKHGWRRYNRGTRGSREYHYHPPDGWDWEAVLKRPATTDE